jgi:ribosomal protein S12 methylthiotransferase accessory factor
MGNRPPQWAQAERLAGPGEAIRRLENWCQAMGFAWDIETLWADGPGSGAATVVRADLLAGGVVAGQGMGKGRGRQALASGLYEAFEDFALSQPVGPCPDVSGRRLAGRGANALVGLLARERRPVAAVTAQAATDPLSGTASASTVLLPAALVEPGYVPDGERSAERRAARYCTSNGVAAGLSAADALLHGLLELAERDAVGALLLDAMAGRKHGAAISLTAVPALETFRRAVGARFGVDVEVRRLESVFGQVVLAWSSAEDGRGCRIVGAGASWDLAYAADRALLELVQNLVVEPLFPAADDGMPASLAALEPFPNLLAAARLDRLPPPRSQTAARHRRAGPPVVQARRSVAALEAAGHAVYARRLLAAKPATDEPGPQVWQAIVPGLDRFHLVRAGWPVEPVARLRSPAALALVRQTVPGRTPEGVPQ